jgi:hypothetical protein
MEIQKKSKLNSEKFRKIQKESERNSERFEKYGRKIS